MTDIIQNFQGKQKEPTSIETKPRPINLRFLFQQSEAGPIIGKGGSNIKAIIEKTKCSMNFYDEYHRNRTLVISGQKTDVVNAVQEVAEIMKNVKDTADESSRISLYWVLARDNAMSLIGKAGVNAKQIKESTDATVSVMFDNRNGARSTSAELLVRIKGTPKQIASVIEVSLKEFISTTFLAMRPMVYSRERYQPKTANGTGEKVDRAPLKYKGPQQFHIESTQTIQLKREFAGAVIGKGGGNISRIRAYSGARINVKSSEEGDEMSSVVVVGRPGCVARAFEMIEECIQIYLANGARIRAGGARRPAERTKQEYKVESREVSPLPPTTGEAPADLGSQ